MIFKKIRKGHVNWQDFLCSTPARDYVFQKDVYEDQIDRAAENIRNADSVIIGAGAGASTAAGIWYGGKRFTDNFAEFIKKYGGLHRNLRLWRFCKTNSNFSENAEINELGRFY